jgi:hypothetical protein
MDRFAASGTLFAIAVIPSVVATTFVESLGHHSDTRVACMALERQIVSHTRTVGGPSDQHTSHDGVGKSVAVSRCRLDVAHQPDPRRGQQASPWNENHVWMLMSTLVVTAIVLAAVVWWRLLI